ncbi:hypothetical protein SAMN04490247_1704 [Salimicrobium halophilum]|uniref:Uncharacterized protein n=1 Tax=Salimicrobium halophilum TaxID=86666 RepID=A0A1G8T700_9BACI|nr:hypothetical protein SAMN04490247_1704 [Salimicrobium halophilum]
MLVMRILMIAMFSATALSVFFYQSVEILAAFMDYFQKK